MSTSSSRTPNSGPTISFFGHVKNFCSDSLKMGFGIELSRILTGQPSCLSGDPVADPSILLSRLLETLLSPLNSIQKMGPQISRLLQTPQGKAFCASIGMLELAQPTQALDVTYHASPSGDLSYCKTDNQFGPYCKDGYFTDAANRVVGEILRVVRPENGNKDSSQGIGKMLRRCLGNPALESAGKAYFAALPDNSTLTDAAGDNKVCIIGNTSFHADTIIGKLSLTDALDPSACESAANDFAAKISKCENWKTETTGLLIDVSIGVGVAIAILAIYAGYYYINARRNADRGSYSNSSVTERTPLRYSGIHAPVNEDRAERGETAAPADKRGSSTADQRSAPDADQPPPYSHVAGRSPA